MRTEPCAQLHKPVKKIFSTHLGGCTCTRCTPPAYATGHPCVCKLCRLPVTSVPCSTCCRWRAGISKVDVRRSIKLADFVCLWNRQTKNLSCKNQPIFSADKIDFIIQHRKHSSLDDKIGQLLGYRAPWWLFTVGGEYLFLLFFGLFSFIRCTENNASIILWFAFCCYVFVKLGDIAQSCKR